MKSLIKNCLPTYEIVDKLGEGIHGSVFRIKDRFKQRAVKIVPIRVERSMLYKTETDLDSKVSQDFHAVRAYYEKIKGDGVIDIFDFHLVDKKVSKKEAIAHLVILMELCPSNLQDYVIDNYPLPESEILGYMKDLAIVLERLSKGVDTFLLTDFKPSNLLLNEKHQLVIGDLGGLKRLSSVSTIANAQFTPNWSAPELVMMGQRPSFHSAIYSYGLVSYYMWEGQLPHEKEEFVERIRRVKEGKVSYTNDKVPYGIRDIILKCLSYNAEDRPQSFKEIIEWLESDKIYTKSGFFAPETEPDITHTIELEDAAPIVQKSTGLRPHGKESWREPLTSMEFVWVPGGWFQMGCLDGDIHALPNEKPPCEVEVKGFWIGRYPVTQHQWQTVMKHNPSHFIKSPDHPVEQVSWNDAIAFCSRLSAMSLDNRFFKLPSEKQWEYAARSCGQEELFSGGTDIDQIAWFRENSGHSTHPVGMKVPNGLGLFDMCGNVMEWCDDIYLDNIFKRNGVPNDGTVSNLQERVARGGGWNVDARRCRTTARRRVSQALEYTNLGLRVVMLEE